MKKTLIFLYWIFLMNSAVDAQPTPARLLTQPDSFDVFIYQRPGLFKKSASTSQVQFYMTNNDTSFCTITLYKSQPSKKDSVQDIVSQWNRQVVKRLTNADKKPAKIMTGQYLNGWASTLAIGNFYQNKKKCVMMLYSFRKEKTVACAVFAFSDKIFKQPIENFSNNLQLKNQP